MFTVGWGYDPHAAHLVAIDSTISSNQFAQAQLLAGGSADLVNVTLFGDNPVYTIDTTGEPTAVRFTNTLIVGACTLDPDLSVVTNGGNLESPGDTCSLTAATDQRNVSYL